MPILHIPSLHHMITLEDTAVIFVLAISYAVICVGREVWNNS